MEPEEAVNPETKRNTTVDTTDDKALKTLQTTEEPTESLVAPSTSSTAELTLLKSEVNLSDVMTSPKPSIKTSSFTVESLIGTELRNVKDQHDSHNNCDQPAHASTTALLSLASSTEAQEPSSSTFTKSAEQELVLLSTTQNQTTAESNICTKAVNVISPPILSSSMLLSPTSRNLVTGWSIQHMIVNSVSNTGHESQQNQPTHTDGISDSILLQSPEKSIEQAVNAALCSLERDMENTEDDNEFPTDAVGESVSDMTTKDAETVSPTREETKNDRQSPILCEKKHETKRMKLEFDPDNIQYTHKPLATTKKPYKPSGENRNIKSYWFREFPWLVYDEVKNLFFCSYCTAVKCDNIFTRGRPAVKPRKDYMVKHEATNPHKTAMSRLKIIPDVSQQRDDQTGEVKRSNKPSSVRQMTPYLIEKIPDEIDASTSHLLKFLPSEQSGPENRIIHERWFLEFTWFVYNHKDGKFFCKLCREDGVKGVYTQGKCASNPKKGDLQVHERTSQHVGVLRKLGLPTPVKREFAKPNKDSIDDDEIMNACTSHEVVEKCDNSDDEIQQQISKAHRRKGRTGTRRQIKSWWFTEFSWLEYNDDDDCFYCKHCRRHDQPGVFSTGKKATVPKKDNFVKHEDTESHHIALLQEAGLSREEAMEQVVSGFGNNQKKNTSLVMASDEDMEMMGYMNTEGTQNIYIPNSQSHDTSVNSHTNTEQQENVQPGIETVELECNRVIIDNQLAQDESALDILASMSVGNRVPQSVLTAASSSHNGQFHNVQMEWFVEFSWLELEELTLKLYCRYCKYFDPCGVFSVGKLSSHSRYDDMKKHNSSESHRRCLQMHEEQFPDTILNIQEESQNSENLTKLTPHHWSILFPWMQHDKATDALFCEPCQQDGMTGSLVTGVHRSNITMLEVEQHEQLVSHRTAVVQYKRRHLATLALPPSTMESLYPAERPSIEVPKTKRKRGRPKKCAPSDTVDVFDNLEVSRQSAPDEYEHEHWTKIFWSMAGRLRHLGILCDVTLSVGINPENIKIFQAHKLVLVCASEFFKACLRDNNFEQYYHFNNISVKGMDGILNFMYGEHGKINPEDYRDVYEAASIFAIPSATAFYKRFLDEKCMENRTNEVYSEHTNGALDDTTVSEIKSKIAREEYEDKNEMSDEEGIKNNLSQNHSSTVGIKDSLFAGKNRSDGLQQNEPDGNDRVHETTEVCDQPIATAEQKQSIEDRKRVLTRTLPTCNVCGKRFLRIGFLKRHKERKHFRNRDKRVYKCEFCPKVCRTPKDIKLHRRRHTGERPFLCNQCGKAFTRRETLMEHAYVHKPDTDKPHKCTECGKGFFKLFDLQRHFTGIHSGLKPFQCHLCGKSFAWSRSLQDHLAGHVGKSRRFTCEHCDMKFVRKYDLQRHQVKHEAKKPFRCNWCGRFFTQKSSMDKHQRDYCRSKPDRKTCALPTGIIPSIAVHQPLPIPQHYDQPVNLTAGVKDMTMTSMELGPSHTTDSADIPGTVPQHDSSQQGFSSYDSFAVNSNIVGQNHVNPVHVYAEPSNIVGATASDPYHNQSMWIPGQNLDPSSSMLFHHNPVSH